MNEKHQKLLFALESGAYEKLFVRRREKNCYFIVRMSGKDEVFVNEFGNSPDYHHVWQIRQWLNERFGIPPEQVDVFMD